MTKQTFLISDETENSHGFSILTEGIDTTRFDKNPVMLYMHQRAVVIGRWENLVKKDGKLFADAVFDLENEFSKEIAGKVERGFLKGASMGIHFDKEDLEPTANSLQKCMLFEISIVDVGSNSNALKLYSELDFKELNFGGLVFSKAEMESLGFAKGTTEAKAITKLTALISANKSMESELKVARALQANEQKEIMDFCLSRRVIKESSKPYYEFLFTQGHEKAKEEISKLFPPIIPTSLMSQIIKPSKENNSKGSKPKSQWDLDDYRKLSPKELEQNPVLYQKLINDKFSITKH